MTTPNQAPKVERLARDRKTHRHNCFCFERDCPNRGTEWVETTENTVTLYCREHAAKVRERTQ